MDPNSPRTDTGRGYLSTAKEERLIDPHIPYVGPINVDLVAEKQRVALGAQPGTRVVATDPFERAAANHQRGCERMLRRAARLRAARTSI